MINKKIIFEKSVEQVLFHQIGVTALFENVGLSVMLSPPKSAYLVLIKQFFGNMSVKSDRINTFFQDKTLSIDFALLGSILDIPYSGQCPFTLKGPIEFENLIVIEQLRIVKDCSSAEFIGLPTVVKTTPLNNVIRKVIRANLVPRTGGRSNMTYQDLILSALILSSTKFNFVLLMIKHMESCLTNKIKCFITKILAHFGISFANEEVVQLSKDIDECESLNSKLMVNPNGILSWDVASFHTQGSVPPTSTLKSPNTSPDHSVLPEPFVLVPPPNPQIFALHQLVQDMGVKLDIVLDTVSSLSNKDQALRERVDTVSERVNLLVTHYNSYVVKLQDFDKKLDEAPIEPATDEAA